MESNFVDYVKILCRSGKGGKGSMHLKHVKYNPNGGPDGGDGGRGGSIYLRGNHNYWTLLHLKYERHIFAEHGGNGGRDKCHGTDGKDIYIDVPCGTVVYNAETGKYVCDVTYDGQEVLLLKGGRGGLGNFQFRTATNQAPRYAQPGEPMQEMTVILELKLLADVGLVGFPNAGKSTLVSALSNAKPKIANYPFTTMEPSLGIVGYRDGKSFVMADIPGIIEGAAEGRGLGLRFLRHIERNSLLLFMVPGDTDDIRREYEILLDELRRFNPELLDKPRVLAVTKCDLLDEELIEMLREETLPLPLPTGRGVDTPASDVLGLQGDDSPPLQGGVGGGSVPIVFISAVTGYGLDELKDVLWREMNADSNKLAAITTTESIAHRDKDMSRFAAELAAEGEDEDIEYIDAEDIEDIDDLEDFEYEEEE